MAHVVLVSYFFTPDNLSTAVLMAELAQDLHARGHKITVVTTTPHSNVLPDSVSRQPLTRRWGTWLQESHLGGIRVLHVKVAPKGSRVWLRAFDYLRYHTLGTLAGWFLVKKPDIILAPSPPLTIGLHAWLLSLLRRVPFVYNVQEVYPDVAVRLGVLRQRWIIGILKRVERFVYARASTVTLISEWFRRALEEKGIAGEGLRVIPNFVDSDFLQPGTRSNDFSRTHELEDKFVVLYAGNVGLTQDFESVLEAATRLDRLEDLRFVVVGGGSRRAWLEEKLGRRQLDNFLLLPYQDRARVPEVYASSDLCLVPMKPGMAQETFPSKIYSIMAASRAVIVSSEVDSELAWLVETTGCGWRVPPDDADALTAAIEAAYQQRDSLRERGARGRPYVLRERSRQAVAQQYDALIREITS